MFGMFRRKRETEPTTQREDIHEFAAEVEIDAPLDRVFELLDFSSPGNALRERGVDIVDISEPGAPGTLFVGCDPEMADVSFSFAVEHRDAPRSIAFKTVMRSSTPVSGLVDSRSVYRLSEAENGQITVEHRELARFRDDLTDEELATEYAMMGIAIYNDLAKLKLHAEIGPDATKLSD